MLTAVGAMAFVMFVIVVEHRSIGKMLITSEVSVTGGSEGETALALALESDGVEVLKAEEPKSSRISLIEWVTELACSAAARSWAGVRGVEKRIFLLLTGNIHSALNSV